MSELSCKVLIVGGGPGGYVAAIRAGELGLDTVLSRTEGSAGPACTSAAYPSKAIIHAADAFHALVEPAALAAHRRRVRAAESSTTRRPSPGRTRSCRGSRPGSAGSWIRRMCAPSAAARRSSTARRAIAHSDTGEQRIVCEHLVIATGSEPFNAAAPAVRRRHPVLDRGARADSRAGKARGGRRGLHRHGARHGLRQARRAGDGDRGAAEDPAALRRGADPTWSPAAPPISGSTCG